MTTEPEYKSPGVVKAVSLVGLCLLALCMTALAWLFWEYSHLMTRVSKLLSKTAHSLRTTTEGMFDEFLASGTQDSSDPADSDAGNAD